MIEWKDGMAKDVAFATDVNVSVSVVVSFIAILCTMTMSD